MLRLHRRTSPVSYDKCNQTVTVYHKDKDGTISRTVIPKAFLDWHKTQSIDKTGSRETNGFLLVIPCDDSPVMVGDKIILGEGPQITTREEWAGFIPAKYPGLVVAATVDPKYWRGKMVHVEVGG